MTDQRQITGEQIAHWTEQISKLRLTAMGEDRHYIDLGNTLTLLPAIISEAFHAGAAYGLAIKPAVIELTLTDTQLSELRRPAPDKSWLEMGPS